MSFPAYPSYKESGVEWLGQIPDHWTVGPLKRKFQVSLGKMLQPEASTNEDQLMPYLRAANIQWSGVDASDIKQMWFSSREMRQLSLAKGDLLVSEGGDVGRSSIWNSEIPDCFFQNSVNRVRAVQSASTRFLYYWLHAIKEHGYIDVICNKSTIAHFTAEKVATVPVPFPSPDEQNIIAKFLDDETSKIDVLIQEQEKLVQLAHERKSATVSKYVVEGVHSPRLVFRTDVPVWLNRSPENWKKCRVKKLLNGVGQGWSPQCESRPVDIGEWGVLKVGCVNGGVFNPNENKALQEGFDTYPELTLKKGDLLVSRANTKALVGSAAVVQEDHKLLMMCDKLFRLKVDTAVCSPKYLSYYLGAAPVRAQIELGANGASDSMQNISQSTILNIPICLPSLEEQFEIVKKVETEIQSVDKLKVQIESGIRLLRERRSALISAAVSGKIDVRGFVAPTN